MRLTIYKCKQLCRVYGDLTIKELQSRIEKYAMRKEASHGSI